MKAAYFYGKHDIRLEQTAVPEPGEYEVLIKVMACGICGTDVHIYEGARGAAETHPPVILGHEFSGIVEKTGAGVQGVKEGDRVCVDPNYSCGGCYFCRKGQAHFCENMVGYGTTTDGGFSQYCCVNYKQVYLLDEAVSFAEGAMTEPVACCLHGIDKCQIKTGSTVLVIGAGMIGLIMVQLAKLAGASIVVVSEPVEEKRKLARQAGADIVMNPQEEESLQVFREHRIKQADVVIECVGFKQTMETAIACAGKNSTVMLFGLGSPDDVIPVKPYEVFAREIDIKASFINPYTQGRALEIIRSGKIRLEPLMAGEIGLSELGEVLAEPKRRRQGKILVNPWL